MAQILGSSTITLPEGGNASVQPDLALFASTGFPYVTVTRPEGGTVYLSSEALRGSALTLIGKLAQISGAVTEGWRIMLGVPPAIGERAIVLATPEALPEDLFANWSAAIGRTVRWPYRMINDLRAGKGAASIAAALDWVTGRKAPPGLRGWVEQDADLGPLGVLMAFRSPAAPVTVTLVTAASEDRLAERLDELVQPELWSQIRGDLVAWDRPGEVAAVMQVADFFVVGQGSRWLTLRLLLSNNPWYWLSGVVGSGAVAALVSVLLLRRRQRALQPERVERG